MLSFGELEFNNQEVARSVGRVPKLPCHNPGLVVDVGVGLWASPMPEESGLLRMNSTTAGASGRRTFCFTDWDGDGMIDLMVNTRPNVNFFRGSGRNAGGQWVFEDQGAVHPERLASHATTPTIVHWNDPRGDLLFGSEDGFFYFLKRPVAAAATKAR